MSSIRANSPEFFGRHLTSIYKQKTFNFRIDDEILQKLNFYGDGVNLISKKYKVGRHGVVYTSVLTTVQIRIYHFIFYM